MPTTALTVQTAKTPFASISANGADITLTAADAVNGNHFACSGKEILIVQNSHAADAHTVTITSVVDEKGRTGTITNYSLAAGEIALFTMGRTLEQGWMQTDGTILVSGSNAAIKLAAVKVTE